MAADLTKPFSESCCDGGACNNDMSAQSCGCDEGASWMCERHRKDKPIKTLIEAAQEASRTLNHPVWLDQAIEEAKRTLWEN